MEVFTIPKEIVDEFLDGNQPRKRVKSVEEIQTWQRSEAYYNAVGFINGISEAIQGKRISSPMHISENMQKLLDIFDVLNTYIDETPPLEQPHRFGNKAYRSWSRKINQDIFLLLQKAIPEDKCHTVSELGTYFAESFGNATRIDYGTGHELSFIFFLCGLFKAEVLVEADNVACALQLFYKYLLLARRLQTTYRMEPAGSQGVWALDDFQFIPFVWGSAQLSFQAPFDPTRFLDEDIITEYKDEYMFIGCIDYINKVKTGHFAEHSNQLWSISAVDSWVKINKGLVKMYLKDILTKFPIIQHVYFGKLMSYESVKLGTVLKLPTVGLLRPEVHKEPAPNVCSLNHHLSAAAKAKDVVTETDAKATVVRDSDAKTAVVTATDVRGTTAKSLEVRATAVNVADRTESK